MKYILLIFLLVTTSAHASTLHYSGEVGVSIYEDGPGPGFRHEEFVSVPLDLSLDMDTNLWDLRAFTQAFGLAMTGPLPEPRPIDSFGGFLLDPESGDFKLRRMYDLTAAISLHEEPWRAYVVTDNFFMTNTGGMFSISDLHTTNSSEGHSWINDYYVSGPVTESSVPEPLSSLLLAAGLLHLGRLKLTKDGRRELSRVTMALATVPGHELKQIHL